jgi:hypothetical protein
MPVLVGWTLIVVLQVPNAPYLQAVQPPEQGLSLERCLMKAKEIMSNFDRPELALCSPIYRKVNNGDPT